MSKSKQPTHNSGVLEALQLIRGSLALAMDMPVIQATTDHSNHITKEVCYSLFDRFGRVDRALRAQTARPALVRAIELDHRNVLAMILLIGTYDNEAHTFADVAELIAKRSKDGVALGIDLDHRCVIANCVHLLDRVGRYEAANSIRLAYMKTDKRDGSGFRHHVVAHALMVGDVASVKKWLSWSRRHQQVRNYWAWAEVLYLSLLSRDHDSAELQSAIQEATDAAPLVPYFILNGTGFYGDVEGDGIVMGSEQEQHYYAAILDRAWWSHREAFRFLDYLAARSTSRRQPLSKH